MRSFVFSCLLALSVAAIGSQRAAAWCDFQIGGCFNMSFSSSGKCFHFSCGCSDAPACGSSECWNGACGGCGGWGNGACAWGGCGSSGYEDLTYALTYGTPANVAPTAQVFESSAWGYTPVAYYPPTLTSPNGR